MKKIIPVLSSLIILTSCFMNKEIPKIEEKTFEPLHIQKDTIIIYRDKQEHLDTLSSKKAYLLAKEFFQKANQEYDSGNFGNSKKIYQEGLKILSKSNMTSEDYYYLNFTGRFEELEEHKRIQELNGNGVKITPEDIEEVFEKEEFPIGKKFAEKIAYEKKVLETKHHNWFMNSWNQMQQYIPLIDSLLEENDLHPFIKWMYPVESAMNPSIKSGAGAVGIAQFMSWTAKHYGLKIEGQWCDERYDPIKSLEASMKYMRHLEDIFDDPEVSIAAYNSGEGRIHRQLNQTKSWTYEDLLESGVLYRETEKHLPKIHAYMTLAKEVPIENVRKDPILEKLIKGNFDLVEVKKPIDFDIIAEQLGIPVKEIKNLNPSYRMWGTPPDHKNYSYEIRIPKGKKEEFYQKIPDLKKRVQDTRKFYTVRSGENPGSIAQKFGVSTKSLMRINNITDPRKLKIGQKLIIPPK
jgi:hypothetical protein